MKHIIYQNIIILFQLIYICAVLQKSEIYFPELSIDNFYVKDIFANIHSIGSWVYRINNIEYYIPNYGYILTFDTNFKDKLQRFYHQNGWQHPVFEEVACETINNKKIFTIMVKDQNGNEIIRAQELSKKKAEQKVSMLALLKYGQLYSDQIVEEFD